MQLNMSATCSIRLHITEGGEMTQLIGLNQVAQTLNVPMRTLRQWISDGKFPIRIARLPNRRLRVAEADLLEYLESIMPRANSNSDVQERHGLQKT